MRNRSAPFFTSRLGSTGTSMTSPLTCGMICTTYFITRTSLLDGATTLSVRIMTVNATIGMITTVTFETVFHGSHFFLMKMNQTKNE